MDGWIENVLRHKNTKKHPFSLSLPLSLSLRLVFVFLFAAFSLSCPCTSTSTVRTVTGGHTVSTGILCVNSAHARKKREEMERLVLAGTDSFREQVRTSRKANRPRYDID